MKPLICAVALAAVSSLSWAADVGVSVTVGQPGFYGTIDIGNYPRPEVIYAEPVIIRTVPVRMEPVYMRVPPGHARNWAKHCAAYNACSRPVYFVQDDWYNGKYVPAWQEKHGRDRGGDERHGDENGHGGEKGHGHKGHGKGHN